MPNPFVFKFYKPVGKDLPWKNEQDYITRKIVMKTVITGYEDEEKTKPIGSMVPTVTEERQNILDLVKKYEKDVGCQNIVNKILDTGDFSLMNQNSEFVDVTGLPSSDADLRARARNLEMLYNSLPADLRAGKTLNQFINDFNDEDLIKYFESKQKKESEAN